jgi:hypothetical protein
MYIKRDWHSFIIITLYVDDLFVFTNDHINILLELKEWLKSNFQMTYKTNTSYGLSIQMINRDRNKGTIHFNQFKYITNIQNVLNFNLGYKLKNNC